MTWVSHMYLNKVLSGLITLKNLLELRSIWDLARVKHSNTSWRDLWQSGRTIVFCSFRPRMPLSVELPPSFSLLKMKTTRPSPPSVHVPTLLNY